MDSAPVPQKPRHPAQDTYDANRKVRQDAFLEAYSKCGTIYKAAQASGVHRETVREWQQVDPGFSTRMLEAHAAFGDYLQDLAMQKVERLESKDNLLHLAMLNAHVPELYRPERAPGTGASTVNITYNFHPDAKPTESAPMVTDAEYRELPGNPESGDPGTTDSATDTGNE